MKKIVYATPSTLTGPTVEEATVVDLLNPTVPLADSESNLVRVGAYVLLSVLLFRS